MKILFVCTGNTCRSPMAERLFQHITHEHPEIKSASAGINVWFRGGRMSAESEKLLRNEGIDTSGFESQPLTKELLDGCDLVLTMGKVHYDYIIKFYPEMFEKVFILKSFVDKNTSSPEILDPYTGEGITYEECFQEIKEAVLKLKKKLESGS